MTKVCITSSGPTLDSQVDPRFGRCAYFIIADPDTGDFEAISNEAAMASGGAGIRAAQLVASQNVDAVITGSVGPNAYPALQNAGIRILTGAFGTVQSALDGYRANSLEEIGTAGPSHLGMGGGMGRGVGGYGTGLGLGRGRGGQGRGMGGGRGSGRGRHRGGGSR
ncbi:MAG: NifB/NifX family molybdenum-iron cluster-binding protein [Candidatus Thorarchaeota archaeon]|nr:MAG: dinitrogenase iron-molybdenum cofactor biosynthesis protein [Candidatus Thorarchaeota archaeon]RLI59733.1 MAG: dinitrogenase iron-molybdenum cofactor biosynthesis protein [Candidatus Thorarchaeota archaeon]